MWRCSSDQRVLKESTNRASRPTSAWSPRRPHCCSSISSANFIQQVSLLLKSTIIFHAALLRLFSKKMTKTRPTLLHITRNRREYWARCHRSHHWDRRQGMPFSESKSSNIPRDVSFLYYSNASSSLSLSTSSRSCFKLGWGGGSRKKLQSLSTISKWELSLTDHQTSASLIKV